jgi:hypothetical protein
MQRADILNLKEIAVSVVNMDGISDRSVRI